mgnify:CR=1 FL=1
MTAGMCSGDDSDDVVFVAMPATKVAALKGYADGREAKAGIASWIAFYNDRRLHQSLGYRTPMAVWRERMQAAQAVDMVDNADALTTCPQQLQQTESLAA